jgi:hypothetical protein
MGGHEVASADNGAADSGGEEGLIVSRDPESSEGSA